MNSVLKWVGVAVGVVVTVLVIAIAIVVSIGEMKINRTIDVTVASVAIPTDAASLERGKHFVESIALCQECHGDNYEGQVMEDDPIFGRLAPPNLTTGRGGVGGELEGIDYVRAIRHGVSREGKALIVMPSDEYNVIGDEELGAIIAYMKSVPPVDNEDPDSRARLIARAIAVMDVAALYPANNIDQAAPRVTPPQVGITAEYGGYLATVCTACHQDDLGGGAIPDGSGTIAPNLTSSGTLAEWSEAEFISTLRTGETPGGNKLDEENMPWDRFKLMTDDELKAVWLYLSSLPPASPSDG